MSCQPVESSQPAFEVFMSVNGDVVRASRSTVQRGKCARSGNQTASEADSIMPRIFVGL